MPPVPTSAGPVSAEPVLSSRAASHQQLKRIALIPFVALLYGYCSGGPFDFEAMISRAGPGMALIFILIVPAHKLPGAREDPLLFFKKSPAIEIKFCGQRPGMGEIRLDLQD